MSNKKQCRFALVAGGLVTLLGLQAALAVAQADAAAQEAAPQETAAQEEGFTREDDSRNPFSFSVSESINYDSNLYRLPKSVSNADAPKGKRSDIYSVTRASVNFDGGRSRQAFHAGLAASYVWYKTHSDLKNTPWDAFLRWDWRIGDRLSGVIGYGYSDTFVGFDNNYTINADDRKRIMRQFQRANASADFWWHPNWATGLGYTGAWVSYNNERYDTGKYDTREASLNITYRPSTGSRIVLSWLAENGKYPNQEETAGSMRDWKRRDVRLSGQWLLTGVTQLSGYFGYTQRKYDFAHNRDFNRPTWRIALHWVPTGKMIIDLAYRKEVGADADLVSNYAESHGLTLQPTWVVTSKVRLGANVEYLDRKYGGDSGVDPTGWYRPRDAKTWVYGANLQYLPVPNANIALGFQYSNRDAKSDERFDYRTQSVYLSGRMTF